MKRLPILCCALSIALWSCADSLSAQGPSTETSGLTARITDSTGAALPAIGVRVIALGNQWNARVGADATPVLAHSRTNSIGVVHFELPDSTPVALEIDDSLHAGRLEVKPGSDSLRELKARPALSLRVMASVPSEVISSVHLAGTGYQASMASDGSWRFKGLSRGTWSVVAATDSGLALLGRVTLTDRSIDTTLSADSDSVLVEDFADAPLQNRYGALLGASWWFTVTDRNEGGNSFTAPSETRQARIPCEDGFCLSMDFTLDPARTQRYALVGNDLDGSFAPGTTTPFLADFTKVRFVRFLASGSGSMLFQIAIRSASGSKLACHVPINLTSTLSLVEIPVAILSCDESGGDFSAVYGMTWTATSDAHLTLGRVRLIGAGPRQVFHQLKAR
ncbi:MAG: hypothetical protein RL318_456 [Fibrobacterota bacterium]